MKPGDAKEVDLIARSLMRDLVTVKFTCPARSMEEEATSNQCSRGRNERHGHRNWLEVCRENMKRNEESKRATPDFWFCFMTPSCTKHT